jgi:tetrahydromethanopterin S-methyltransferase subunit H
MFMTEPHQRDLNSNEAIRCNLEFLTDLADSPKFVVGDRKKIRTVVANLTANAGMSRHFVLSA